MKTSLTFLICLLLSLVTQAIDTKDKGWHAGVLYLKNSEVVKGKIKLNTNPSLVQCKTDGKILTYSPYQIKVFQYYDEENHRSKIYTSVLDYKRGKLGQRKFLEVVLTGEICILRDEHYGVKQVSPAFDSHEGREAFIRHNTYMEVTQHNYFIYAGENLVRIKNFRKDVFVLFKNHKEQVDDFITGQQLDINTNIYDQLEVVKYYNKLQNNESLSLKKELSLHAD